MKLKPSSLRHDETLGRKKPRSLVVIILSFSSILVFYNTCVTQEAWIGENRTMLDSGAVPELQNEGVIFEQDQLDPELEDTDIVYQKNRWEAPIVVEEYKFIFFPIPKVGCTEWTELIRSMMGFPAWDWTNDPMWHMHDPRTNGLKYLSSYEKEEAQEMLTSDEWTRAVFVREPKERILSAFLDKFVNDPMFRNNCCHEKVLGDDLEAQNDCLSRRSVDDFSYFLKRTLDCHDPHWNPQAMTIDPKWWDVINFVGYMDNVAADAEKLLKSIKSSKGTSAWDDYGATGWGKNKNSAFMVRDTAGHATNAHSKLYKSYTKCDEAFVEKHWSIDYEHDVYHFDKIPLFENEDLSDCTDMLLEVQ